MDGEKGVWGERKRVERGKTEVERERKRQREKYKYLLVVPL